MLDLDLTNWPNHFANVKRKKLATGSSIATEHKSKNGRAASKQIPLKDHLVYVVGEKNLELTGGGKFRRCGTAARARTRTPGWNSEMAVAESAGDGAMLS